MKRPWTEMEHWLLCEWIWGSGRIYEWAARMLHVQSMRALVLGVCAVKLVNKSFVHRVR